MKKLCFLNLVTLYLLLFLLSCQTKEQIVSTALTLSQNKDAKEAILIYENALKKVNSEKLLYNVSYSYLEENEFYKALEKANEGILLYPNYLRFYYLKAFILEKLGFWNEYKETLNEVLRLDPVNKIASKALMDALVLEGKKEEAGEVAKNVLKYDVTNKNAQNILSLTSPFYRSLTNYKEKVTETIWQRDYSINNISSFSEKILNNNKDKMPVIQILSNSEASYKNFLLRSEVLNAYLEKLKEIEENGKKIKLNLEEVKDIVLKRIIRGEDLKNNSILIIQESL